MYILKFIFFICILDAECSCKSIAEVVACTGLKGFLSDFHILSSALSFLPEDNPSISVFLSYALSRFIAILVNNAFKTVQQSAKDKEDICRRADARQRYLTQDFTL